MTIVRKVDRGPVEVGCPVEPPDRTLLHPQRVDEKYRELMERVATSRSPGWPARAAPTWAR
jgi:hypothetical protein